MEIGLIGQPNAGKSALFTKLTGIGAISSNYPGTTVEFQEGSVVRHGVRLNFHDLPGTYSLTGISEDELVATTLLAEKQLEAVVAVADATRLEQSLVLIFQLIELGFKVVVALNQIDVARKRYALDAQHLEEILGVPVVPTVAITGEGVEDLVDMLVSGRSKASEFEVRYDRHIENLLEDLCVDPECMTGKFPKRGALLKLLEGNRFFAEQFSDAFKERVRQATVEFREDHGEDIEVHINRDRYGEAGRIANGVISNRVPPRKLSERVSDATLRPHTGIPILVAVLGGIFLVIVFVGGFVEGALISIYNAIVGDLFLKLADLIGGTLGGAIAEGINLAFQAILAIVIPYIMLFYLMLGMMEDSGYMPRVVVLLDGVMHRIGLHGRAVIPMIVGMGCNVPAILSTRVLESRRERLILAIVIVIAVPCSAQTAVIIGTVGNFAGAVWALGIYVILVAILLVLGRVLHRFLFKFEPTSLAMEIPELRWPQPRNVLWKTWVRTKDFFVVAFPILLVGSIVLEILMTYGVLQALVAPLAPFTEGFLGLPAITIVALIFGILRKEMALQMLVVLFGTANLALVMTPEQLFVFALIMATYLPCLSALLVLSREFGWKDSLKISLASVTFAFLLGGLVNALFQIF
ncbi:MAG TPA: ferrous iron transport protein B [Methanomassiliicoccales archaeon]|nr:ferrous iron transport protein B [Methanomassiliicoccales archaeon]